MEDGSDLRGDSAGATGVVAVALIVDAAKPLGSGVVMAYARPSDAIRAVVAAVAKERGQASAAVMTAELSDEQTLAARLRSMLGIGAAGSVVASLATRELARASLDAEFRFEDLGTHDLPGGADRLFEVSHPSLPTQRLTPEAPGWYPNVFVGRTRELEDLRHRLDHARIVTVVGPSGIGKSALIRRFVSEFGEEFPDGVIEADLGSIGQPSVVVPLLMRLAGAVRLPGESGGDALVAHLRDRRALVVLDNAEGVLPEIQRLVGALVKGAPNVAILIGSQRATRLPGEARLKVEGLETPSPFEDWRAIQEYDAIALFVDRAQLVEPKFKLTAANAQDVARLCESLDGIPLAIEMAAAKVSILSPKQILGRLDYRFQLLTDDSPGRPKRHRTLRATIDWGYEQLRPEAKVLLRRLSPFSGAFSLDEASAVAVDETKLTEETIFGAFDELVESSMLTPSSLGGGEKRFYLPETVQIYAKEKLRQAGEDREVAARHREWCIEVARGAAKGLVGPEQLEWLHRLDAGYEDLRLLIEREAGYRGDAQLAMELLVSIANYFFHRTYLGEGLRLCDLILKTPKARSRPLYGRILNLAAALSMRLGDLVDARRYALRSHRIFRRKGDVSMAAAARTTLALIAQECDHPSRARRHYLSAAASFRRIQEEGRLMTVLVNLVGNETDLEIEEALLHAEEAERLLARHPNPVLEAYLNQNRAHLELRRNDPARALELTRRAAEFVVSSGDQTAIGTCWRNAAYSLERLDRPVATAYFIGAVRRTARSGESHLRGRYRESWMDLTERTKKSLGSEFEEFETLGYLATVEEAYERLQYETSV
jgi:predicted ATPase